jgi:hypothetical protein
MPHTIDYHLWAFHFKQNPVISAPTTPPLHHSDLFQLFFSRFSIDNT